MAGHAGHKGKSALQQRPGTKAKEAKKERAASKKKEAPPPDDETPFRTGLDQRRPQQLALNIFRDTFLSVLSSETFTTDLQNIKQALFERDFIKAFANPDSLAVYAARWSPTRALCYASILGRIHKQDYFRGVIQPAPSNSENLNDQPPETTTTPPTKANLLKLLCIGGCAAEIVAFGSFLGHIQNPPPPPQDENIIINKNKKATVPLTGDLTLIDSGPWASVISQLGETLLTLPTLPKYAGQMLKDSNRPMLTPSTLTTRFIQQDVLSLDKPALQNLIDPTTPILSTLLFTLNELFTTSGILKTTTFLLNLTAALPLGSLLLVVDSPGSYSETTLASTRKPKKPTTSPGTCETIEEEGEDENATNAISNKNYPMQWLLDKILLGTVEDPVEGKSWTKLESHDSLWFRLPDKPQELDYPIQLENMRYQMHLYRVETATMK